jgi:hypothetical protein
MGVKLNGSSSGSVELNAPANTTSGADVVLTLPVNDGDSGQYLQTNGSGALSWQTVASSDPFHWTTTSGSAVTSIDFTIPTNARQVTVAYHKWDPGNYSANSNNRLIIRFGTGATPTFKTSGYRIMSANNNNTSYGIATNNYSGISTYLWQANAAESGTFIFSRAGANTWHVTGRTNMLEAGFTLYDATVGGYFDLGDNPTAVRLTTIAESVNFTSGDFSVGYLTDD